MGCRRVEVNHKRCQTQWLGTSEQGPLNGRSYWLKCWTGQQSNLGVKKKHKMRDKHKQVYQDAGLYTWLWRRSQIRCIRLDMNCVLLSSTLTNLEAQRFCLERKKVDLISHTCQVCVAIKTYLTIMALVLRHIIHAENGGYVARFRVHCNKKDLTKICISYLLGGFPRESSNMHWQKLLRTMSATWSYKGRTLNALHTGLWTENMTPFHLMSTHPAVDLRGRTMV